MRNGFSVAIAPGTLLPERQCQQDLALEQQTVLQ